MQAMLQEIGSGTFGISGRIMQSGAPAAGVRVTAGSRTAFTTAAGDYTLPAMPPGSYTVQPSQPGLAFTPPAVSIVVGPDRSGVDFQAASTGPPPAAPVRLSASQV